MATTDTDVQNLIVNKLTYAQWKAAKAAGTLSETEAYEFTDTDTALQEKLTQGTGITISNNVITNTGVKKVVTGSANGTISVDGDDVAVKGLGSAAYKDVTSTYSDTGTDPVTGTAVKSAIDAAISSVYKPAGSVAFASLPTPAKAIEGNVYNVTDAFTTNNKFVEGAGKSYPAGTNVVVINTTGTAYAFDVLTGMVDLSNYQTLITSTNKIPASNVSGLATVATSGSYNDLSDKPYIPEGITIDQTYSATSTNAQSGKAVAGAISTKQDTLVSGTNIKTINNSSILGSGNISVDSLPTQTGQSGKFLTTNGTAASWANVDALPSQTGQSGKYLTTDGATASWGDTIETTEASLKTINGNSLIGTGDITITSAPSTDGTTINTNTDDKLQAIGVIEKNTGAIKYDWVGTLAQWTTGRTAGTIPDTWICYITDDETTSVSVDWSSLINVPAAVVALSTTGGNAEILGQINNRIYTGRNLSTVFADEISSYTDAWSWIKARITAGNYAGLYVGDYIPLTINAGSIGGVSIAAQTFQMQIAGIDTYYRCTDKDLGHHIDFISRELVDTSTNPLWNPSDSNNGTANTPYPWLASNIYAWLNGVNNYTTSAYNNMAHGGNYSSGGLLQLLPSSVQNLIITKRNLLDQRYSATAALTYSTGWDWQDMGKLWLPNEIEVYGTQIRSNLGYSQGYWNPEANMGIAYPLFSDSGYQRIKYTSTGGRYSWWLSSSTAHYAATCCNVNRSGSANGNLATTTGIRVPICFRIA